MLNPFASFLGSLRGCFLLGLLLSSYLVGAQTCECPPVNSCGACSGGLTGLTLKFVGGASNLIEVSDNSGTFFSNTLDPGDEFSFSGTLPNQKFQGPNITIKVSNVVNVTLASGCGTPIFVGETYGSFKIVAGQSLGGGALCCSPSNIETTPPVISNCPSDISQELTVGACTKAVSWTVPSAADNCELESLTSDHAPGEQFPLGTTLVTYTATDIYGNVSTCSFNVIVADTQNPVISGCPSNVNVSASAACDAIATWNAPIANDNCTVASFTSNHNPGSVFPIGTTQVIYTAIDGAGNTSTCSFNVIVADNEPPVFANCPSDILVTVESACSALVTWSSPTATDNCGTPVISGSHLSGELFPIGVTQVSCAATDASGNTATCTFNVIVSNQSPPQILNCPVDIIVTANSPDELVNVSWIEPTASVTCGSVTLNRSHNPNDGFPVGITQVNYTAVGQGGKTATCSFVITVNYNAGDIEIKPVITPDGDGFNDTWEIKYIDQYDNTVIVVDRWGGVVFQATNYNNDTVSWDGTIGGGASAPTGTYFYTVEILRGGQREKRKGFIELIR